MTLISVRDDALAAEANAFENELYGPDFYTGAQEIRHWLQSSSFFWALSSDPGEDGSPPKISGTISILVTTVQAANALSSGAIKETQLEVWSPRHGRGRAVLYFCSFAANSPKLGGALYRTALNYFSAFFSRYEVQPQSAVSIAATKDGEDHLRRCGFTFGSEHQYLGKYQFAHATCSIRLTPIWAELLRCS